MDSESTTNDLVSRRTRFAIAPEALILDPRLSDRSLRIYLLLDRYAGNGGACFPHRSTLADRLGVSERTIDRGIQELAACGWITKTRTQKGNHYILEAEPDTSVDPETPPPDKSGDSEPDKSGDCIEEGEPVERETGTLSGSTSRQAQLALSEGGASIVQLPRQYGKQAALDEFKKAITDVCGEPTTKSGWGLVNRFATMIRDRGDPPESVGLRATLMAQEWGPSKVTVTSLEKHWGRYDEGRVGRLSQEEIDDYQQQVRDLQFRRRLDEIGGEP